METEKHTVSIPEWLYTVIVASLGIYFIIGAVIWSVLAVSGRRMPDAFATILATIAGGLVGKLHPVVPRSAARRSDSASKGP
jgi:hypothetical protein